MRRGGEKTGPDIATKREGSTNPGVEQEICRTHRHRTLKVLGFSPALTAWYGEQRSNAQLHDYQRLRIGLRFTRDL